MIANLISRTWALEEHFNNVMATQLLRTGSVTVRRNGGQLLRLTADEMKPMAAAPGYNRLGRMTTQSGQVVVIPIMDTMSRYGDACSFGSEDVAAWIAEANADGSVSGIVLEINSPGGDVDGTEMLGHAVKNSKKPIVAWVAGMAASAAYWVASQASEIVAESEVSTRVGSIGVLAMHVDASAALEKEGYKVTIIRSDGSEDKALFNSVEPLGEDIVTNTKAELNQIRSQFIDIVKAGRPGIANDVFSGKMFSGKDAKKRKMVDRFGSLSDAVRRADLLARTPKPSNSNQANSMSFLSSFFTKNDVQTDNDAERVLTETLQANTLRIAELEQSNTDITANLTAQIEANASLSATNADLTAQLQAFADAGVTAEAFAQLQSWYTEAKKVGAGLPAQDAAGTNSTKRKSYEDTPWNRKARGEE